MNYQLTLTIQAHSGLTRAELEARVSAVVGNLDSAGTPWRLGADPDSGVADGKQEGADRRAAAELGEIVRRRRAGE